MAKSSKIKKQIVENTRNKVANHYKRTIERLEEVISIKNRRVKATEARCRKLDQENEDLKQQIVEQQDWIDRLLEYMDMSPRERDVHIALARDDKKRKERKNDMFDILSDLLNAYV